MQDSTNRLEVSPVTLVRTCSASNPLNNTLSSNFCLKDPSMSVVSNKPKEQNLLACSWVTPLNLVTIEKSIVPSYVYSIHVSTVVKPKFHYHIYQHFTPLRFTPSHPISTLILSLFIRVDLPQRNPVHFFRPTLGYN